MTYECPCACLWFDLIYMAMLKVYTLATKSYTRHTKRLATRRPSLSFPSTSNSLHGASAVVGNLALTSHWFRSSTRKRTASAYAKIFLIKWAQNSRGGRSDGRIYSICTTQTSFFPMSAVCSIRFPLRNNNPCRWSEYCLAQASLQT